MDPFLQWGLDFIIAVQQISGPALNTFFKAITFMGEEEFFLLFVPFLLWCVDTKVGARIAIIFLLSAFVNAFLKSIFQEPRPFMLDSSVKLHDVEGTGMPSGHSQSSVAVWGTVASQVKRRWSWGIAGLMAFLIGFSRVYLGVHFPTQVLAGWAMGGVLLALYLGLHLRIEEWLTRMRPQQQLIVALAVPIILVLIYPHDDTVAAMAVTSGFGVGMVLTGRWLPAKGSGGQWGKRIGRYIVGVAIMLGIYLGLSAVFPGDESPLYFVFRYLRYGLVGLWISLGAPWVFVQLRLLDSEIPSTAHA